MMCGEEATWFECCEDCWLREKVLEELSSVMSLSFVKLELSTFVTR